jgi:hypothetical protein
MSLFPTENCKLRIKGLPGRTNGRQNLKTALLALSMIAVPTTVGMMIAPVAIAQSNISGDLTGTVIDPAGAVLSGATVTVTSEANGQVKETTTDNQGGWRVPLLSPGKYKVAITASGFSTTTQTAQISAGVNTPLTTKLSVGQNTATVEVSGSEAALLHTDDAQISTTFDLQQIQNLPNPGNDLTFVAQTAPGAVMNTQGGYGNFSTNGLPATSNTFTMNGGYEGDPYLNLNNSGATNLLLGNNDVDQVTVTTNAYDAAFGGLGGAQVNEISRSGSNRWHGNLVYFWNGSVMNANDTFNKMAGAERPFDNANQWAASIGGPLKKDKIFGFIDTEGLRVLIPSRATVYAPSPNYQATVLGVAGAGDADCSGPNALKTCLTPYGNLADNGLSSEAPLYQNIFNYYNNAKGYTSGAVDPNDPDTWIFNGQTTSFGQEWLVNGRMDYNVSDKDHLFVHFKVDHGLQPTQTSILNSIFSAFSPQPSYEGQLGLTHTFTPQVTNQFLFAASYYRAIFTNTQATSLAATIPFTLIPESQASTTLNDDGSCARCYDWDLALNSGSWVGGADYAFPQGRNVTGYQFNDDLSWTKGKSTIKVGFTMRRDDITDYTPSEHNIAYAGGENFILDPGDFGAGYSDEWAERFALHLSEPVALYVMGAYVQDQWKPVSNLSITAGLRLEHNSNPKCNTNCVANFADNFANLSTDPGTAYNTLFDSGRKRAFASQQNIAYEPRLGFSYQPGGTSSKTTIRGGFGMFADYFPAQIMGDLLSNVPNVDRFTILGTAYGNPITVDTNLASSGHANAVASNAALQELFPAGGSYTSISAATGGSFTRPTVIGTTRKISLPTYEEWSLAVEHQFGRATVFAVQYVGNHGYHEPVSRLPNAYDKYGTNASLPLTLPNQSFGSVTEYYSGASSNFNGIIATLTSHYKLISGQLNYSHGHALDEASNGGFDAFGVNGNSQINPYNLKDNYGNADYDTHHYISANYSIMAPTWHHGPKALTEGWELDGTVFHNSGYPFSVTDDTGDITYGTIALAKQIDNNFDHKCGGLSHTATSCDFASHFTSSTDFGQQHRNQIYGPSFTDLDVDVAKAFAIPHWEGAHLKIAAQFYNVFNHSNFQIPLADVTDGPSNGLIYTSANVPTSILGAFLGGDAAPRLIQFKGTFNF